METDERTHEAVATEIRDAADALNKLLLEAAARGLKVELEVQAFTPTDATVPAPRLTLRGVFSKVEPTPRPPVAPPVSGRRKH